jgi:hypothetical protein
MADWSDSEETVISSAPAYTKSASNNDNNDGDDWGDKFENVHISSGGNNKNNMNCQRELN